MACLKCQALRLWTRITKKLTLRSASLSGANASFIPDKISFYIPNIFHAIHFVFCRSFCIGMLETGLRVGEALALQWSNVQLSKKKILVRKTVVRLANKKKSFVQDSTKSESSRRAIPMTPTVSQLLQLLYDRRLTEWVFETEKQQRVSCEALRYQLKKACVAADVPYKGEHVLRHTFATNCYHKGIDTNLK